MTIEKLLEMSADELDKLTQEQLNVYFAPHLVITHPDYLEEKPVKHNTKRTIAPDKIDEVNALFQKFGVNIKVKRT